MLIAWHDVMFVLLRRLIRGAAVRNMAGLTEGDADVEREARLDAQRPTPALNRYASGLVYRTSAAASSVCAAESGTLASTGSYLTLSAEYLRFPW